jgi:hypothetical protein
MAHSKHLQLDLQQFEPELTELQTVLKELGESI